MLLNVELFKPEPFKPEPFKPHANFDSAINRAMCQAEIEGGLALDDVPVGAEIEVETTHHTYQLENRGDGKVIISGHPEYCPMPVLVDLHGSTWGTNMIKMRFIGRGMKLEFRHPTLGLVRTSRIREVRELNPAPQSNEQLQRKVS